MSAVQDKQHFDITMCFNVRVSRCFEKFNNIVSNKCRELKIILSGIENHVSVTLPACLHEKFKPSVKRTLATGDHGDAWRRVDASEIFKLM